MSPASAWRWAKLMAWHHSVHDTVFSGSYLDTQFAFISLADRATHALE